MLLETKISEQHVYEDEKLIWWDKQHILQQWELSVNRMDGDFVVFFEVEQKQSPFMRYLLNSFYYE